MHAKYSCDFFLLFLNTLPFRTLKVRERKLESGTMSVDVPLYVERTEDDILA